MIFTVAIDAAENVTILHSPTGINAGRWGPWELCPKGEWVTSWRVREFHDGKDKEGLTGNYITFSLKAGLICVLQPTGLQVACYNSGSSLLLTSLVGENGKWASTWAPKCANGFSKVEKKMHKLVRLS